MQMLSLTKNIPLSPTEQQRILDAHNKPGVIDKLSPVELRAKTAELRKSSTFTETERRLLIEAELLLATHLPHAPHPHNHTP